MGFKPDAALRGFRSRFEQALDIAVDLFDVRAVLLLGALDIFCDLRFPNSSSFNWNMKSVGNRSRFRRTAWLSTRVGTSYNSATSLSSMTFEPRIR